MVDDMKEDMSVLEGLLFISDYLELLELLDLVFIINIGLFR